ncbi:DUF1415 domain-containing protein [Alteromonas sp. ASW11-36]|uniref:DUF1415 domain-containing protein n=1 Tax=Alteromonas arenosi TaxID=3055817 RepID=A0ABT7SU46_9ALTE|nr:DUF1415 domain-containing protein [Alteromonas sp. ASW11-36]MDM7859721.1 DUF1415 domain-containing protein [Alteromonas sp. ASW11-36]
MTHAAHVEQATRYWVEKVVVGENFCPFAKREVLAKSIAYVVVDTPRIDEQIALLVNECERVLATPSIATSLFIIAPNGASERANSYDINSFDDFLFLVEQAEWAMQRRDYAGTLQLATFHPDYCFAGEENDSPANYTNRSPYPILHILREESLDRALKTFSAPEQIPERNIAHAHALGTAFFQRALQRALEGNEDDT